MVRKRATRFTPKPTDSVSVATKVSIPTVTRTQTSTPVTTTASRTQRATRFTPTPTPTPRPTPRPTPNVFSPTPTPTQRVTTTPTIIGSIPRERIERTATRFTPRPTPPRDDFQRTLNPLPLAFAEESPRQVIPRTTQQTVQRSVSGRGGTRVARIIPVRTTPKDSISVVATPRERFSVPLEEQQRANQALLDAGLPTVREQQQREGLSDFDRTFASFGGGVTGEIQNLRSIIDEDVRPTREVGSLAIDLPFAVAGETFTRPSAQVSGGLFGSGGFGGLGFDFRESPDFDAGFEKSGKLQKEIGTKFEEDPARAVGSIFAVGAVEAGLLVTTGGVGNLARRGILKVGQQIATSKGRKLTEKIAREQPAAKKGIPQLIENLGDGRFAILQGFEQIGKRVGNIRVLKGGGVVATTTTKSGKLIEKELDLITGITRKGTRGKLKGKTIKVTAKVEKQAEVPLIIVDTKSRLIKNAVTGRVVKEAPRTRFFNKNIPDRSKFLDDPELLNIIGADTSSLKIIGKKTGLKAVKGKKFALVSEGKIPKATIKATAEAEKFGQIRASARGISVLTKDASSTKGGLANLIGTFAVRQEPIVTGKLPRLSRAEIIEGIRVGAPTPRATETLKGIPFQSTEIFGARTVGGRSLSNFLSPDSSGRITTKSRPKGKGKGKATERQDDFNVLNPFTPSTRPRTVLAKGKPTPPPRTRTQDVFEAFTTPTRKVRPTKIPVGARVAVGTVPLQVRLPTRARDDFAIVQGDIIGQLPSQRAGTETALDQGSFLGQPQPSRQDQPFRDRPVTTPFFQEDVIPRERVTTPQIVIPQLTTGTPTPPFFPQETIPKTPSGLGGGLPSPFFPPDDAEKRKRGTKKKRGSQLGGRLFDIADEPFGEVAVGLGFFVETERGETSIEDALGFDDEPITRQEKQARARLGVGKGRRRQQNFAEGFGLTDFF